MFQFVHVNSYSRTLSKKASHAKWTAADVVAEATRDASAIPHIDNPQDPIHVHGKPIGELLGALDHWAANTKDAGGKRATRKDAVCLLAGVFSAPDGTPVEDWQQIKNDAIKHLVDKYGDQLQTVLEHVDEDHPHCHFYVIPEPGKAFETIHEGRAAVKEFIAKGGNKRESNGVYREAMRGFQDAYFDAVGAKNGMARIGPGRRRLTRSAWKAEQLQALAIKVQMSKADALVKNAEGLQSDAVEQSNIIRAEALQAAKMLNDSALQDADRLRDQAIAHGFEEGLREVEKMPWWARMGAYITSVTRERDRLKIELAEALEQKSGLQKTVDTLTKKLELVSEKAQKYWESGRDLLKLFRVAKPKAAKTDLLVVENKQLRGELSAKTELVQHLVEVGRVLKDENAELNTILSQEREEVRLKNVALAREKHQKNDEKGLAVK